MKIFLAENFAPLVVKVSENYSHVISSANTFGKNLMPRVAALLDTSQVSDIIKVISPDTFLRPIYAGNAFATVKSTDAKKCVTIRPTSFEPCETSGGSAPIEKKVRRDLILNLLKEKKLNQIDQNLEQLELSFQVAEECKVGKTLN